MGRFESTCIDSQFAVDGDRFIRFGIQQCPATLVFAAADLDMLVVAAVDTLVDELQFCFDSLVERRERLLDGGEQDRRANVLEHCILVLSARVADQVVLESAILGAVLAIHVTLLNEVA